MKNSKFGITFIEMIVVVAIVALVAAVSFSSFGRTSQKNDVDKSISTLRSLVAAAHAYEMHHPENLRETELDWANNWKEYLSEYVLPLKDEAPDSPILRLGSPKTVEYSMQVGEASRDFYAYHVTTGDVMRMDWNGVLEVMDGVEPHTTTDPDDPECNSHADCSDGNKCNGDETCAGGKCKNGVPLSCTPSGNVCQMMTCDPQDGCEARNDIDGTSCADSNKCNGEETCVDGVCEAGESIVCEDDNDPCTSQSCDPDTGTCEATALLNGAPCAGGFCHEGICYA